MLRLRNAVLFKKAVHAEYKYYKSRRTKVEKATCARLIEMAEAYEKEEVEEFYDHEEAALGFKFKNELPPG